MHCRLLKPVVFCQIVIYSVVNNVNFFSIKMLQHYSKFLEVCSLGKFDSGRSIAVQCVNFIYTNKKGCDEIYLLDLSVCAILECSCLKRWSSGEIFGITKCSELP